MQLPDIIIQIFRCPSLYPSLRRLYEAILHLVRGELPSIRNASPHNLPFDQFR